MQAVMRLVMLAAGTQCEPLQALYGRWVVGLNFELKKTPSATLYSSVYFLLSSFPKIN